MALKAMTGAFKGSPYKALEIEASIPSPEVRFERLCNRYAIYTLSFNTLHPFHQLVRSTVIDELDESLYSFTIQIRELPPHTQLFRLIKRMETIGFRAQLETLFLNEKPWSTQPLKAKVVISTKTKEEETREHQRLIR